MIVCCLFSSYNTYVDDYGSLCPSYRCDYTELKKKRNSFFFFDLYFFVDNMMTVNDERSDDIYIIQTKYY